MKHFLSLFLPLVLGLSSASAATVNWSAGIDHGFSSSGGAELPIGAVVRLGWFRDSGTGVQLTDAQIQALAGSPTALNNSFVEAASSTIGSGFTPALASHFAASSTIDTGTSGLNLVGKQMYVWVLNAASVGAASEHAVLYWDISNTATNPDGSPQAPGVRWSFPGQDPVPGSTTVDLTDLTTGTGGLAAGAKLLIGSYPTGTSGTSSAANFGLATLATSLAISSTSPLAPGALTVAYPSQTLTATGGSGALTWTVFSGALPNGVSLATTGLISGTPTQSGVFNFTAQVEDATNATATKAFTLTIAAAPLSITTASPLPGGTQGGVYSQNLAATGGVGGYTWAITGGALPGSVNLSSGGTVSGSPSTSGTFNFTVQVTDSIGLSTSAPFALTITNSPLAIITASPLKNAFTTLLFNQTLAASGGVGSLTWTVDSGALPTGLGLAPNGVVSGTPTVLGPFSFTIKVTDSTGPVATKAFTQTVLATLIKPVMDVPAFPTTIVSQGTFSYTLTAANYPKTFSATGLPAGLKLNTTTGVISGRPTASGIFNVQVKATNKAGTGPIVIAKLTVKALPNGAIGTFVGHITRQAVVNSNLGGRVDLTTTAVGGYTLKVTQGSKLTSSTGVIAATPNGDPQINVTVGTIQIALTLNHAANALGGTVTVSGNSAVVTGWRKTWNTLSNPAYALAGYYTMGIDLTTHIGTATVPQGTSYASFTVGLDGGLTLSGKTADGNPLATPGFVGPNGEVLVHQALYVVKGTANGSMVGQLALAKDSDDTFEDNTITGNVSWFKAGTVTLTYPDTFGPLTLAAYGKYMAWSSKGSVVLGLPDTSLPASLGFAEGGVELSNAPSPDVAEFYYTGVTAVPMPATAQANPGKATLTINAATGAIAGTFTLVEPSPSTLTRSKVPFQGLIVRYPTGGIKAAGYYLLSQIPVSPQTIKTSPVKSGQVVITQ